MHHCTAGRNAFALCSRVRCISHGLPAVVHAGHMRHPSHKQQHCTDGAVLLQDQDLNTEDCRPLLYSDVTDQTDHPASGHYNRQLQMEALAEDALVLQLGGDDDVDAGSTQSQSDGEDEIQGEEAMLKHSFWGLFAIGAVAGLATGLLGGATGVASNAGMAHSVDPQMHVCNVAVPQLQEDVHADCTRCTQLLVATPATHHYNCNLRAVEMSHSAHSALSWLAGISGPPMMLMHAYLNACKSAPHRFSG